MTLVHPACVIAIVAGVAGILLPAMVARANGMRAIPSIVFCVVAAIPFVRERASRRGRGRA